MSNVDDARGVRVIVKVITRSLYLGAYSNVQEWLFQRVAALRDDEKLTFAAIAAKLAKFGVRSARGSTLCAESVFSTYKKGKLREKRLAELPQVELVEVMII